MIKLLGIIYLFASLTTPLYAQVKGQVLDFSSETPIPDVIIKTENEEVLSDDNGFFVLQNNPQKITFSKSEFEDLTIEYKGHRNELKVYLNQIPTELEEVVIYGKQLTVEEIFNRVVDSAYNNYISSNVPLIYDFQTSLKTLDEQLVFFFSKEIILYNKKPKKNSILNYYNWYLTDEDSIKYYQPLTRALKSNYSNSYNQLGNDNQSLLNIIPKNYSQNANVFLSTVEVDGDYYYNILLVAIKPSEIKIGLSKSLLSREQRERFENTKLIRLSNYQVRIKDYAVLNYQTFALSADDFSIQSLNKITNEKELHSWIANNVSNNNFYFHHYLNFKKSSTTNKYFLSYRSIRDNVLLWNVKEQYNENLVFYESYNYLSEIKNFDLKSIKEFEPNEYIYNRLTKLGLR